MKRHILSICTLVALCLGGMTSCSDIDDVKDLVLDRVLSPTNISARVSNNTNIVVSWDAMDGATGYEVQAFADSDDYDNLTPDATATTTEDTYTLTGLLGETDYYIRVRAIDENDASRNSKWVEIMRTTNPEQNLNAISDDDLASDGVTLSWTAGLDIDKIVITPTTEGSTTETVTYTPTADEKAAGTVTLTGLVSETTYHVALMLGEKTRGYADFTTLVDVGNATAIYPEDDWVSLIEGATDGEAFAFFPGTYTVAGETSQVGSVTIKANIEIKAVRPGDRPIINTRFKMDEGASLTMKQVVMDGTGTDGGQAFDFVAATVYNSLILDDCEVKNYTKGFFYVSLASEITEITINNCLIHDITCDGGDLFDSRKGCIHSLTIQNSTIWNSCTSRDFVRMDDASSSFAGTAPVMTVDHCTLDGVSNNSSRRLFYVRFKGNSITFTNNMVTNMPDCGRGFSDNANTATPTFKNNNYYNTKNLLSEGGEGKAKFFDADGTEIDPKYKDQASGDFTITNEDIMYGGIGDPRWY